MSPGSPVPREWIDGCKAAHRRLETLLEDLSDGMAARPCGLPGWSVAHLLTHLARNADSHTGQVEAAGRGEMGLAYPGGSAQRDSDIAAGQGRSAGELMSDLGSANRRLEEAWATTLEEVWATGLGVRGRGPVTIADAVFRRWREVEVHLVDLGLPELAAPDWDGLSPAYINLEWQELLCGVGERVPNGIAILLVPGNRPSRAFGDGPELVTVRASPGRILGWLFGRGGEPSWPVLAPWS